MIFQITSQFNQTLELWSNAFESEQLQLSAEVKSTFAPFSDLNQLCIYYINDYLMISDEKIANPAFVYPVRNRETFTMVSASMFFLDQELEKFSYGSKPYESQILQKRMILNHEMGHMLGLDHQFSVPSVMGYSGVVDPNTTYDLPALNFLYQR